MGETRVDLIHLLEDLRDAYVDPIEETILSEAIANSLDSRASVVSIDIDANASTLTIRDNGTGMGRSELRRYHDLARSSKQRGEGIGFAGVGIKLGLLISTEVWTESVRAGHQPVATRWRLSSKHKAPWKFCDPFAEPRSSGTSVRFFLNNPLSPLLDAAFVADAVRRHFEALFEPHLYPAFSARYPDGVTFELNGEVLDARAKSNAAVVEVRLPRKKKAAGMGLMWRSDDTLPEGRQGIAISTFGKVIKRGWDWLGVSPPTPEKVGGIIELPALAESLTLNKGDFIRSGIRGSLYLICRKAMQETVITQLETWGEGGASADEEARRKAARPFERDLAGVLEGLSADYPALASLVAHRPVNGGRKLRTFELEGVAEDEPLGGVFAAAPGEQDGVEASAVPTPAPSSDVPDSADDVDAESLEPPASRDDPLAAGTNVLSPVPTRRAGRYGLSLSFESRPDDEALGRLVENTVCVNVAHPAYRRAERTRAEAYHLALVSAMSLARVAVEPGEYDAFVTDFLKRWGSTTENRGRRRPRV
ncbi:MAG: ATP-binding protein [Vicinamibacteria bacterium]|nr:ATP-binding protein [Vicinamibacteria bacterium]